LVGNSVVFIWHVDKNTVQFDLWIKVSQIVS